MIKKITMLCVLTSAISGCAALQTAPQKNYVPAQQVVQPPPVVQIPNATANYHLAYGNDPALEKAFTHYVATGNAPNIVTQGFIKFAYNANQQPIINMSPFQETVISLEPGEKFTNISSGDPSQWSYSVAVSGSGDTQQQQVLVKPALPNICTNLVITTDKRLYTLRLISSATNPNTKTVSFWYPDEMVANVNQATQQQTGTGTVAQVPNVDLNHLNFKYSISSGFFSPAPYWKPTRVFDDGTHTYIQFPDCVTNQELPALFVVNKGTQSLVNYQFKSPYFVVNQLFQQAILVMGVGHNQTKVTITNQQGIE